MGVWPTTRGCGLLQGGVAYYRGVWPTTRGCGLLHGGVAYYMGVWPTTWGCGLLHGGVSYMGCSLHVPVWPRIGICSMEEEGFKRKRGCD